MKKIGKIIVYVAEVERFLSKKDCRYLNRFKNKRNYKIQTLQLFERST